MEHSTFSIGSCEMFDDPTIKHASRKRKKSKDPPAEPSPEDSEELPTNLLDALDPSTWVDKKEDLKAHKEDLITDYLLPEIKIMAFTETWLNNNQRVDLNGYRCVTKFKRENVRAGGVALYEKKECMLFSTPHILMKFDKKLTKLDRATATSEHCGDICAVESTINGQRTLIVTVYVSPNSPVEDIECFFLTNLLMYTPKASEMFEQIRKKGYGPIPIILSGDINLDLKKPESRQFVNFMRHTFELQLKTQPSLSTTRGGSCIDAVFTRHVDKIDTANYVSYFSYHKPLLSITSSD